MTDVKNVILSAKKFLEFILSDENITNLGLEEIEYDEENDNWKVTLGFSRPWNSPKTSTQYLMEQISAQPLPLKRSYKVVTVNNQGEAISMKNRERVDSEV